MTDRAGKPVRWAPSAAPAGRVAGAADAFGQDRAGLDRRIVALRSGQSLSPSAEHGQARVNPLGPVQWPSTCASTAM